jgi:hypothetical protein
MATRPQVQSNYPPSRAWQARQVNQRRRAADLRKTHMRACPLSRPNRRLAVISRSAIFPAPLRTAKRRRSTGRRDLNGFGLDEGGTAEICRPVRASRTMRCSAGASKKDGVSRVPGWDTSWRRTSARISLREDSCSFSMTGRPAWCRRRSITPAAKPPAAFTTSIQAAREWGTHRPGRVGLPTTRGAVVCMSEAACTPITPEETTKPARAFENSLAYARCLIASAWW